MKTIIIVCHSLGIIAGVVVVSNFSPGVTKIAGCVSMAANTLGVYLSSVYKTGDPDAGPK